MKTTHNVNALLAMRQNSAKAASMLKQLASAPRLMILCQLVGAEKSVGELLDSIRLSQSALSQHLARLRKSGLVTSEKRGQMVYYRLKSVEAQAILTTLYLIYCQ